MLYSYFAAKRSFDGTVGFSCDSVVEWCRYRPNYDDKNKKINYQIKELICELSKSGYNYFNMIDEKSIKKNNYTEARLNIEKFELPPQFALIYLDEIYKIQNIKDITSKIDPKLGRKNNKVSPPILLLILSYLRMNMLRREKNYIGKFSDKPEFCFRMYKTIEADLGISSRYISQGIEILEDLGLIVTYTMPRYKDDDGNWHTEVTLFADRYRRTDKGDSFRDDYDYEQELKWGMEYVNEKKWLKKKFYQNTE